MKATASVSTSFAATHEHHRVGLLVTLAADPPAARPPINVALVLDRSSSMAGDPLTHARAAALPVAGFLTARDRLAVVAFADEARLLFGPGPGDAAEALRAIGGLTAEGCTNLSGGWLEAHRQVSRELVEGTNRVLLFTDGQANRGLVETTPMQGMVRGAAGQGVSTSCIGFGAEFNEDLLRAMSDAGGGHFWYVESADQMSGAFEGEIEGLISLAAQNVVLEVTLTHPGVAGVTFLPHGPVECLPDGGWRVALGALYAVAPRSVGVIFHVEDAAELGAVALGRVRLTADVLRPEGIEHRAIVLPVMATLDGQDHVAPEVEATFLRFAAAEAREEAIRQADAGDLLGAANTLREAAVAIGPDPADKGLAETHADLMAEAERLAVRLYDSADRKYHLARSAMVRDGRAGQEKKFTRRRRP
jgi:Ca-activated chloride channel homolog